VLSAISLWFTIIAKKSGWIKIPHFRWKIKFPMVLLIINGLILKTPQSYARSLAFIPLLPKITHLVVMPRWVGCPVPLFALYDSQRGVCTGSWVLQTSPLKIPHFLKKWSWGVFWYNIDYQQTKFPTSVEKLPKTPQSYARSLAFMPVYIYLPSQPYFSFLQQKEKYQKKVPPLVQMLRRTKG